MFRHNRSLAENWADPTHAEAEALKVQARFEDLNAWERELVNESWKSSKTYT